MKNFILFFLLFFVVQSAMGQACGKYRVRIVGNLMKPENVEMVKVPRIYYLENPSVESSEDVYINTIPFQGKISIELPSPTTSHLYDTPEDLVKFYKKKLEYYPLIILTKGEERREIKVDVKWEDIQVKKIEDDNFGNLFEFDLRDIWVYYGNGEIGVERTNFKLNN